MEQLPRHRASRGTTLAHGTWQLRIAVRTLLWEIALLGHELSRRGVGDAPASRAIPDAARAALRLLHDDGPRPLSALPLDDEEDRRALAARLAEEGLIELFPGERDAGEPTLRITATGEYRLLLDTEPPDVRPRDSGGLPLHADHVYGAASVLRHVRNALA